LQYEGIDLVILPVSDLAAASAPFERLGLAITPTEVNPLSGSAFRMIPVGGLDNLFSIELLSTADPADLGTTVTGQRLRGVVDKGLASIVLRVPDLTAALAALGEKEIQQTARISRVEDGVTLYEVAILSAPSDAATGLGLIQYAQGSSERHAQAAAQGGHALPHKRLDHLAAVAPDLERSCRFWDEVLGVPTVGEVVSPTVVVRQLRIGDAMFELLGPATPDSPIRQRPPGLNSMCSFEVPDLATAITHARAAGFDVPDHRIGTLPGTIVTTVSAEQMSGLNLQLLQYL
jgi:catechol 2,3-dioxygenase-like lactoylglutathione lyase family enzyme